MFTKPNIGVAPVIYAAHMQYDSNDHGGRSGLLHGLHLFGLPQANILVGPQSVLAGQNVFCLVELEYMIAQCH